MKPTVHAFLYFAFALSALAQEPEKLDKKPTPQPAVNTPAPAQLRAWTNDAKGEAQPLQSGAQVAPGTPVTVAVSGRKVAFRVEALAGGQFTAPLHQVLKLAVLDPEGKVTGVESAAAFTMGAGMAVRVTAVNFENESIAEFIVTAQGTTATGGGPGGAAGAMAPAQSPKGSAVPAARAPAQKLHVSVLGATDLTAAWQRFSTEVYAAGGVPRFFDLSNQEHQQYLVQRGIDRGWQAKAGSVPALVVQDASGREVLIRAVASEADALAVLRQLQSK